MSLHAEGRAVSGVCLRVVGCVPVCVGCRDDGGGGNLSVSAHRGLPGACPSAFSPRARLDSCSFHVAPESAILMRPGHTRGLPVGIPERVPGLSRWRVDRGRVQLAPETSVSEGQGHGHTCWLPQ